MVLRLRLARVLVVPLLVLGGCVSSLQDRTAFKRAEILPTKIQAAIGDVVQFELRPPVREGTRWMLETYPPVRFTRSDDQQFYDWVANGHPIHLEAVVGPWQVRMRGAESGRTSWLWFAANDEADPEPYEQALPIQVLPYKELGPVTASSAFDVGSREPRLAASYSERADRVYITYKTPIEKGTPRLPGVYPILVETRGKKVLYAEVWTDFGEYPFERVGHRVLLSYSGAIKGPLEVVIVEWTGHGESAGPFDIHRLLISGLPSSSDEPSKAGAAGATSAAPNTGASATPSGSSSAAAPASAPSGSTKASPPASAPTSAPSAKSGAVAPPPAR